MKTRRRFACAESSIALIVAFLLSSASGRAEDWPQWMGPDRLGNWKESGVLEKFPDGGLKISWRTPVGGGYSGPVVADARVFVVDFHLAPDTTRLDGTESVVCLDETTGKVLWKHEWPVDYGVLMQSYATGPRATPTIDGDRIYVVGAVGHLLCLNTKNGEVIWKKDTVKEYGVSIPTWGTSSAPLIDGDRVICIVGAEPEGKAMAFNKITGAEIWRAISSDSEIGYSQPMIFEAGGTRQLIIWHPKAVVSLNPETGKVYWEQAYQSPSGMAIATPVKSGNYLFLSNFYGGSLMLELAQNEPGAKVLWQIKGKSEKPEGTESLHTVMTTPIIEGDYIYGVDSYGELRCLNAKTGERIWEDKTMTRQGRWGSAFWARNGDRWFVSNDQGELLIAKFTPEKYIELGRVPLIKPNTDAGFGPRRFYQSVVNWVQPAFANRHVIIRNDEEVIRASLESE